MAILKLPGGTALSDFRLDKLNAAIADVSPDLRVSATQFWHFVEVEHEPTIEEQQTLDRLLRYGPEGPVPSDLRTTVVVVTPRLGTISPWSNKATDISHNCGLEEVERIEAEDPDVEAILLGYGLCGGATAGLTSKRVPLVLSSSLLTSAEVSASLSRLAPPNTTPRRGLGPAFFRITQQK